MAESTSTPQVPAALTPLEAMSLLEVAASPDEDTSAAASARQDQSAEAGTSEDETEQQDAEATEEEAEDESEESEEEAAEQDDAAEEQEETEEQQDDRPQTYTVKVDGKEVEVELNELLSGYSRTSDYTKKTQKLADERKAFEAEAKSVQEERVQLAQRLKELTAAVDQLTGNTPEPDWDKLRAERPDDYALVYADWQRQREAVRKIQEERAAAERKVAEDEKRRFDERLASEYEALKEKAPEFRDAEKAKALTKRIREYGESLGLAPEELAAIADHRAVLVLQKAMLYDEAQARAGKVKEKAAKTAPVIKPGARKTTPPSAERARQQVAKRFQKTGTKEDAMELLKGLV